jgi:quercetin dioxygenase-like cupin family protein
MLHAFKISLLTFVLLSFSSTTVSQNVQNPSSPSSDKSSVIYFPSKDVSASFDKGSVIFPGKDRNYTVITGHRDKTGQAEVHAKDTDIIYVVDGTATFVTGGKAVDAKETSPGETRANSIDGGEARELAKGDVIIVPAGVPHWFKTVPGTFNYFVVKVR